MSEGTTDYRLLLRQALQAVEEMKGRLWAAEQAVREPVAIIGASCRFPGAQDGLASYWDLLATGRDAVRAVPQARWHGGLSGPDAATWHAGIIDDVDHFDSLFFGISAREANAMDPQHRMVLETAWHALENAALNPAGLLGSLTGVFIGITGGDFGQIVHDTGHDLVDNYTTTGNACNAAAGRLSYFLGLRGPSVSIDTACSSSLAAIHWACLSLRSHECRTALAGGVNALLSLDTFMCLGNWHMMSADGQCKVFDERANGLVRAEGCGIVVLKRLSDAVADGDRVLAVVRGSAVNHDGRSSGLTVPNGPAQEEVIRTALYRAGLKPDEIDYVEAHGTGTALGDPIEANALASVLGRERSTPLVVGSVKANFGHLEAAAGVAGLLKIVLALEHGVVPRQLHFQKLNPHIEWADSRIEIPVSNRPWPRGDRPRRAGVSSFGFSGTNAHVIVEEAPEPAPRSGEPRSVLVLPLSARSESGLKELTRRYAAELELRETDAADMCYTAGVGRAPFEIRAAYVATTAEELKGKLREAAPTAAGHVVVRNETKVAFLFTGQGAQYAGMGRQLYATEPAFRQVIDECDAHDLLYNAGAQERLDNTRSAQPALFVLQCALVALWKSWGVEPKAVLGHSVGEYAALCAAGVYTISDGLRLITARGRLMSELPAGGAMAALLTPEHQVRGVLPAGVSIAAVNGRANTVVSGPVAGVERLCRQFESQGVRVERLRVSHAFHSALVEPVADEFAALTKGIRFRAPIIRFVSSVTGRPAMGAELSEAGYWRRQVLETVQFGEALAQLSDIDAFVEIGPGSTLLAFAREGLRSGASVWAPSIRRQRGDSAQMAESLASLYARGVNVKWEAYAGGRGGRRVSLPTYPFERRRHWIDESANRPAREPIRLGSRHPILGELIELAGVGTLWRTELSNTDPSWIADHRVQGRTLVPASAYVELALAAAFDIYGETPVRIENVVFQTPLFLPDGARFCVQCKLSSDGRFEVHSCPREEESAWTLRVVADVRPVPAPEGAIQPPPRAGKEIGRAEFYRVFAELGNDWGPQFQGVAEAWVASAEGWSRVEVLPALATELAAYHFHPAVADACSHILPAINAFGPNATRRVLVGQSIGDVTYFGRPNGSALFAYARSRPNDDPSISVGDIDVFNEDGTQVARVEGAISRYLETESNRGPSFDHWFYKVEWQPAQLGAPAAPASWVLYGGDNDLCRELAHVIRATDSPCLVLPPDASLSESLRRGTAHRVIYCGALSASTRDCSVRSCAVLLRLVHELREFPGSQLHVLTSGAETPAPISETSIWQAPIWGLGRTLAVEHAEVWGGLFDLDPSETAPLAAHQLWRALANPPREDQLAFRDGILLAARLQRTPAPPLASPCIVPGGSYLITGGFGGLGLDLARWLVRSGARRLILMTRTQLPERAEWVDLTPNTVQEEMAAAVRELECAGADVHPVSIDVGNETAVRRFVECWSREGRPPIRGIMHAAGLLRRSLAASTTAQDLEATFHPKAGAVALHHAFDCVPLDWFVLFSSASALIGSPGLGAYAAANALLDALARVRTAAGQCAVSINWGAWRHAGMAARLSVAETRSYTEHGMDGMTTAQGMDALARLLSGNLANCAVLPIDWESWFAAYPAISSSPFLSNVRSLAARENETHRSASHQILALPPTGRRSAIEHYLRNLLGTVTGFGASKIELHRSVTDFGLDSLTALETKNRILTDTGVSLPIVRFLDGGSIEQICAEITDRLLDQGIAHLTERELLARADELCEHDLDSALALILAVANPEGEQQCPPGLGVANQLSQERPRRNEVELNPGTGDLTVEQKRELLKRLLRRQFDAERYPLSFGQRAFWFLYRLAPRSASYNVAVSLHFKPRLDLDRFERALQAVVSRHEPLRSVVVGDAADPWQEVSTVACTLEVRDAQDLSSDELGDVIHADYRLPFEPGTCPAVRAFIYRRKDGDVFLFSSHHLAFDAHSALLLIGELRSAYGGIALPPVTSAYRDFVYWQRHMLASPHGKLLEAYWSEYLAAEIPVLRLRCTQNRHSLPSGTGGSVPFSIERPLLEQLRSFAQERRTTLYTVVLLAWSALLTRESGQTEIVVGMPVSGRTRPEWASLIGCFVNTLPLRVRIDASARLISHLPAIIKSVQRALEHQDFPLSVIVDRTSVRRHAAQSPLFQTMLNIVRVSGGYGTEALFTVDPQMRVYFGSGHLEPFPLKQQEGQFDWAVDLAEFEHSVHGHIKHSAAAGTIDDARRLARLFVSLLEEMIAENVEREDFAV